MKNCKTCLKVKSLDEFSPRKNGLLGRNAHCKNCNAKKIKERRAKDPEKTRELKREYYRKNREKINEQKKLYRKKPEVKKKIKEYTDSRKKEALEAVKRCYRKNPEYRKKRNEYNKKWQKENYEKILINNETQKKRYPEKHKARWMLRQAVRNGKIMKPNSCSKCGAEPKRIEGHHEDYSKPFDVVWLCVDCHKSLHGKLT